MDIFSGIASILGGGLTGLAGSVVQRIYEFKSKKIDLQIEQQRLANEIALRKIDAEIQKNEWASRIKVAETEGDSTAFNTALTSEPKRFSKAKLTNSQNWLMVLLDLLRGIVRPGLTIYLCTIITIIYTRAYNLLDKEILSPASAFELVTSIVNTILYLTTTAVLFYFGTRNKHVKN